MWIGSPLLVHGRCEKAIFDISNSIAYNNKMIYASYDQPEVACEWIHVEGKAVNQHFVRNQADVILPMAIEAFKNSWKAGKEADMVILCLGVDSSDRGNGAIGWASEKPNILNVAVTRAKNRLYIVGDAKRWSGRPFFKTVYEICTKRSPAL